MRIFEYRCCTCSVQLCRVLRQRSSRQRHSNTLSITSQTPRLCPGHDSHDALMCSNAAEGGQSGGQQAPKRTVEHGTPPQHHHLHGDVGSFPPQRTAGNRHQSASSSMARHRSGGKWRCCQLRAQLQMARQSSAPAGRRSGRGSTRSAGSRKPLVQVRRSRGGSSRRRQAQRRLHSWLLRR